MSTKSTILLIESPTFEQIHVYKEYADDLNGKYYITVFTQNDVENVYTEISKEMATIIENIVKLARAQKKQGVQEA